MRKRGLTKRVVGLLAIAFLSVSCGSVPTINRPATESKVPVLRATILPGANEDPPATFVGISISGGGSRAANLGAAVLQELQKIGLLEQVTTISSVSGGSIPAAYYSLHGEPQSLAFWQTMRAKMGTDFFSKWLVKVLNPINMVLTLREGYTRSDLMAEVFDEELFHKATFADLGKRPGNKLFLNASSLTGGDPFVFTEEYFNHRASYLYSALGPFPISQAVMASGAFPGVFPNVTLRHWAFIRDNDGKPYWQDSYEHLFDGGPADNLGVSALLKSARSSFREAAARGKAQRCLLIIVDAFPDYASNGRHLHDRDTRKGISYLFDKNAIETFDLLLKFRRTDLLRRPGLLIQELETTAPRLKRFSNFRLFGDDTGQRPRGPQQAWQELEYAWLDEARSAEEVEARCLAWHISPANLGNLAINPIGRYGTDGDNEYSWPTDTTKTDRTDSDDLRFLFSDIETHYKLASSTGCSSEDLQEAIYQMAERLVREDPFAKKFVCEALSASTKESVREFCAAPFREIVNKKVACASRFSSAR